MRSLVSWKRCVESESWGLLFFLILLTSCLSSPVSDHPRFQKGMAFPTWVAGQYCSSKSDESLQLLAQTTCTEWVQLVPTWYQQDKYSVDIFPDHEGMTARDKCLLQAIRTAHSLSLKVMLKPHLDALSGEWRGTFQPQTPEEWFSNYQKMILNYAELAEKERVEILAVGCEFVELTTAEFTSEWEEIIQAVRESYSGELVYAANWGREFLQVEFWPQLDFMGIDGYFELTSKTDPTLDELVAAWIPYVGEMETQSSFWQKPILLTEIGYRSIDGSNTRPWDWETPGTVDCVEQALCYQAVWKAFKGKEWLAGIYWWNWEPDPSRGGLNDKGYTPQRKPAEGILKRWYCGLGSTKKGRTKR